MKKQKAKNTQPLLIIRINDTQKEFIRQMAKENDLSMSEYCKKMIFNQNQTNSLNLELQNTKQELLNLLQEASQRMSNIREDMYAMQNRINGLDKKNREQNNKIEKLEKVESKFSQIFLPKFYKLVLEAKQDVFLNAKEIKKIENTLFEKLDNLVTQNLLAEVIVDLKNQINTLAIKEY